MNIKIKHINDLLNELISRSIQDSCIKGMALGGSLNSGSNDLFSDVDLFISINDGYGEIKYETNIIKNIISRPVSQYIIDYRGNSYAYSRQYLIYLFKESLLLDFNFYKSNEIPYLERWRKRKILFDHTGELTQRISEASSCNTFKLFSDYIKQNINEISTTFYMKLLSYLKHSFRGDFILSKRNAYDFCVPIALLLRYVSNVPPDAFLAPVHKISVDLSSKIITSVWDPLNLYTYTSKDKDIKYINFAIEVYDDLLKSASFTLGDQQKAFRDEIYKLIDRIGQNI